MTPLSKYIGINLNNIYTEKGMDNIKAYFRHINAKKLTTLDQSQIEVGLNEK